MVARSHMNFQGNMVTCIEPDLESYSLPGPVSDMKHGYVFAPEPYFELWLWSGMTRTAWVFPLSCHVSDPCTGGRG